MRYVELINRYGYVIVGHLSAREIYEYKVQGYWMLRRKEGTNA